MADEDLYGLLGIAMDADQAAIRRAYQKLARRYHPDLHPGDRRAEKRFEAIVRAYEVLFDPDSRRRYDGGELDDKSGPSASAFARGRSIGLEARLEELEAVLVESEETARVGPARGSDLAAEVTLEFGEAIRGVTTSLSVQLEETCPDCGGQGLQHRVSCARCGGRGVIVELERMRLRIPPGVGSGSRVRVRGKGNPGEGGGDRGDLYVTVRLRPHRYFHRRGADIHAQVPITVAEAIVGAEIEVPTIDGPVRVRVPPGTSSGQRFRLKRRGVPRPGGDRGDHYYSVRIVVPREADRELRELAQKLRQPDPRRDLPREPL